MMHDTKIVSAKTKKVKNMDETYSPWREARRILPIFVAFYLAIVAITLFMFPDLVFAQPRGVTWSHDGENLAGFKIYEHLGDSVGEPLIIPGADRRADIDVPDDGNCHTYMITAYNGDPETGPESGYSNTLAICPKKVLPEVENPPSKVLGFRIEGTIEVVGN